MSINKISNPKKILKEIERMMDESKQSQEITTRIKHRQLSLITSKTPNT